VLWWSWRHELHQEELDEKAPVYHKAKNESSLGQKFPSDA
jgi:hypothetical protein